METLGWSSFQQLCLTIVSEVLGQTVESFLDTNDGGRDGAFCGTWTSRSGESFSGAFVVQCKFTSRANHNLQPSELTEEIQKIERLVGQGICDIYILLTNAGISGRNHEIIVQQIKDAGVSQVAIFGSTWLTQQIVENKRLRMLVPRVYGLGDLTQILDERAYSQARAILDSMREDLSKIVVTDAYRTAATSLDQTGFVLLVGEPASGKTTIASMLSMAAVDQWGTSLIKLEDASKIANVWNPQEPSQFFWIDDAFGVSQYDSSTAYRWNQVVSHAKSILRMGGKIVMTSRDYIYHRARRDLKHSAFPLLQESQVVIDVHGLSLPEKRQILYNHLKLGKQSMAFRRSIKPYLETVAAHPRFIPEIARRLADPLFTRGLSLSAESLNRFVDKREQLLEEVLDGLDGDSLSALALVYIRGDRLVSPVVPTDSEQQAISRLGSTLGGCVRGLESLAGSLLVTVFSEGDVVWRFKHPTVGDAFAAKLSKNPEFLGIFLAGTAVEKLVFQVVAGEVEMEKAVVIPRSLHPLLVEKLLQFSRTTLRSPVGLSTTASDAVFRFLSYRSSKEFLKLYLASDPTIVEKVSDPHLYLAWNAKVDLAIRLKEYGLLPEPHRLRFIECISEYAINGNDLYALQDADIRSVFEESEFERLLARVRTELVPRLDEVRREWESDYYLDRGSPADHMSPFFDSLEALEREFSMDTGVLGIVARERSQAEDWVSGSEPAEDESPRRILGQGDRQQDAPSARSIFDDVDI